MIFFHVILGAILGSIFGNIWYWIIGSLIIDADHLYVLLKNKIFRWNKFIDTLKFEDKYKIHYKTPLLHSVLGLVIMTGIVYLINPLGALYFGIAYALHIIIDCFDIDKMYPLFPLKFSIKGFLPIWSKSEKILTIIGLIILAVLNI